MKTRAPGKIVLSGAYAVLEGAPAIVAAVDRYAIADASRPAAFVTEEVRAALGAERAPFFDASALRADDKKLGLGSSAAILVASLGAVLARERGIEMDDALRGAVFDDAVAAHRQAQGGGSGIDVAASVYGGTIVATPAGSDLGVRSVSLPSALSIVVWFSGQPASTPALVARVNELGASRPDVHRELMARLRSAADRAVSAVDANDAAGFVTALESQLQTFIELGKQAGAAIVTPEVERLAAVAARDRATVLPAGAGGGDVAFYVGLGPPGPDVLRAAASERHEPLALALGARGLHLWDVPRS